MIKMIDLHGQKFGLLTVVSRVGKYWECLCECGKTTKARSHDLRAGRRTGCGCFNSGWPSLSYTTEEFIDQSIKVHGVKYDYSEVIYTRSPNPVTIICKTHGRFTQVAGNHLSGYGCQKCKKTGFNPSKRGVLYVLANDTMVKIGITNNTADKRLRVINRTTENKFSVVKEFKLDGATCVKLEAALLGFLRKSYTSPEDKFDGYTETFVGARQDDILEMIECLV